MTTTTKTSRQRDQLVVKVTRWLDTNGFATMEEVVEVSGLDQEQTMSLLRYGVSLGLVVEVGDGFGPIPDGWAASRECGLLIGMLGLD